MINNTENRETTGRVAMIAAASSSATAAVVAGMQSGPLWQKVVTAAVISAVVSLVLVLVLRRFMKL